MLGVTIYIRLEHIYKHTGCWQTAELLIKKKIKRKITVTAE